MAKTRHSLFCAILMLGAFGSGGSAFSAVPSSVLSQKAAPAPKTSQHVQLAQATDPRVFQLEEQIRQLNGRVEELNFLMLEMQEQFRRMQKDNEFRFQELENSDRSDAGPSITPQGNNAPAQNDVATIIEQDASSNISTSAPTLGTPEQQLGSIRFDSNGNPIGAEANNVITSGLPSENMGADALYQSGYDLILAGDYAAAEQLFREHQTNFPGDARAVDVSFWLGESLLGQDRFADAAEAYLAISRDQPQSTRAPDALFKLGMALVGLGRNDIACSTFDQVPARYPQAAPALLSRVAAERVSANC